jgi:hypothetical protein
MNLSVIISLIPPFTGYRITELNEIRITMDGSPRIVQ